MDEELTPLLDFKNLSIAFDRRDNDLVEKKRRLGCREGLKKEVRNQEDEMFSFDRLQPRIGIGLSPSSNFERSHYKIRSASNNSAAASF